MQPRAPDTTLESNGRAIAEAQHYLNVLGYEAGSVDGVLGVDTRRAIQRFQRVVNLSATGELTPQTLHSLRTEAQNEKNAPANTRPQPGQASPNVGSQVQAPTRNLEMFRELGLRVVNGELVFPQGYLPENEQRAYGNFFKLIRLKARPELLDAQDQTIQFVSFLPPQERAAFLSPTGGQWKGRDQFELEDSRRSFLSQHKARILDLVPSLPIAAAIAKPLNTDQYSRERQGFDLTARSGGDSIEVWSSNPDTAGGLPGAYSGNMGSVVVSTPAKLPNFLRANETDARQIKEIERASPTNRLVANVHFSFTEIRRLENRGVGLDTVLDRIDLSMGNQTLGPSVILPMPEFTAAAGSRSESSSEPPLLNADVGRLIAVKVHPQFLENEDFIRRSLQIRIDTERHMSQRRGRTMDGSNGPLMLSGSLIQGNAKPSEADIAKYKELMQRRSSQVGKVLRLQQIAAPGDMINLRDSFQGWEIGRTQPLSSEVQALLRQRIPSAMGFVTAAAADDLPVIVGLHPSMHWAGMQNTYGRGVRLSVDFDMLSAEIITIGTRPCLLVVLNPKAIGVDRPGGQPTMAALAATPANTGYKYDIVGARLGMDLDEAVSKIKSAFPEYQTASAELEGKSADPLLRFVQVDVGSNGNVVERLFVGTKLGSRTVIFIKRGWSQNSRDSTPAEAQGMADAIRQKYGPPSHVSINKTTSVWVADPVFKGGIERAQCWGSPAFVYDRDSLSYSHIVQRCGEILSVQQHGARAGYLLFDSTAIVDAEEAVTRKAPPAPVAPSGTKSRL